MTATYWFSRPAQRAECHPEPAGRIPFRVRLGVTGHRMLTDEPAVAEAVRNRLRLLEQWFPDTNATPVVFSIVSALAEGADRLVAATVLEKFEGADVRLEAVLPFPADVYRRDFRAPQSATEFDQLLKRAASVVTVPEVPDPLEAYERAGQHVVDRCDVLVAVWNGHAASGRGGTADIVAYARQQNVHVIVVDADQPESGSGAGATRPRCLEGLASAFARIEAYNRLSLDAPGPSELLEDHVRVLERVAHRSAIHWSCQQVADWALPHFARADYLALRHQRRYNQLGATLFAASAFAVTAVAAQVVFKPSRPVWAILEVALMLLLLTGFLLGRRSGAHDRWIAYRSLAEAFRAALFIALTGHREQSAGDDGTIGGDPGAHWFQRAFSEAWRRRPLVEQRDADAAELGRVLAEAWIADQIAYHRSFVVKARRRQSIMTSGIVTLFACTLLVGTLHVVDVAHEEPWPDVFSFLAITLPGFGAALTGIRDQRLYRLHSERSTRTADRLERVRRATATETSLATIQALALEAQALVVQENVDWSGVIEFQDVEIIL